VRDVGAAAFALVVEVFAGLPAGRRAALAGLAAAFFVVERFGAFFATVPSSSWMLSVGIGQLSALRTRASGSGGPISGRTK
jgi:hypothetical protein